METVSSSAVPPRVQLPITLMIITLNEERNIERCIRSVPFASEILVIDSGSRDRTLEIAQKNGAKTLHHEWVGFGPQKKWGTTQARYDWVLSLDADEALSPELALEIQKKFSELDPKTGYELPRLSLHLGRWIRHGGWYPDAQLRLYHRQFSNWPDSKIHERVQSPKVSRLENDLFHYVFLDLSHQVQTNNRYSSLLAEKDVEMGKRFSFFKLLLKPWSKLIETYFLKLGFLDGLPGLMISVGAAYSIFLRHSKIWEIERRKKVGQ